MRAIAERLGVDISPRATSTGGEKDSTHRLPTLFSRQTQCALYDDQKEPRSRYSHVGWKCAPTAKWLLIVQNVGMPWAIPYEGAFPVGLMEVSSGHDPRWTRLKDLRGPPHSPTQSSRTGSSERIARARRHGCVRTGCLFIGLSTGAAMPTCGCPLRARGQKRIKMELFPMRHLRACVRWPDWIN